MTPELQRFLTAIVPMFREAAFFIGYRGKRRYRSAFEALSEVAHYNGLPPKSAVAALDAWTGVKSEEWNGWRSVRIANALREAADSFEAQLERAA